LTVATTGLSEPRAKTKAIATAAKVLRMWVYTPSLRFNGYGMSGCRRNAMCQLV
jgi:hypothetical protein